MKARKITVLKEVYTNKTIKEIKDLELANTMHETYQVKQMQVNVIKEGGKK